MERRLHFEQLSSVQRAEALLQRVAPRVMQPLEVLPPAGGAAARPAEVAAAAAEATRAEDDAPRPPAEWAMALRRSPFRSTQRPPASAAEAAPAASAGGPAGRTKGGEARGRGSLSARVLRGEHVGHAEMSQARREEADARAEAETAASANAEAEAKVKAETEAEATVKAEAEAEAVAKAAVAKTEAESRAAPAAAAPSSAPVRPAPLTREVTTSSVVCGSSSATSDTVAAAPAEGGGKGDGAGEAAAARGEAAAALKLEAKAKAAREAKLDNGRKLYTAVRRGEVERVRQVLTQPHRDVNCRDRDLNTPLIWAAKLRSTEAARALLGCADLDVNRANAQKQTALHVAAAAGLSEMVSLLRARPTLVPELRDAEGHTAHALAARGTTAAHAEAAALLAEPMAMRHGCNAPPPAAASECSSPLLRSPVCSVAASPVASRHCGICAAPTANAATCC